MPDSLLNLVTRGRKSDHIPGERRHDRLRREFPITEARVPDHCGRKRLVRRGTHARSRRQFRAGEQTGITSALSGRRQPPVPIVLPQVERWPAQIQNSEIASGSTAGPEVGPPLLQMYSAKNDRNGLRAQTSASQGKGGIAAWKTFFFSYCRAVAARWSRASRSCCGLWWACPDVPGGTRLASTRADIRAPLHLKQPL